MRQTFCGAKCAAIENARSIGWPKGHVIRWTVETYLEEFDEQTQRDAIRLAWGLWEAVTPIRTEYVASGANVVISSRTIDPKGGILAEAELGFNVDANSVRRLWMDKSEMWVLAKNPGSGMMDFLRVMAHELGHILGIVHAPDHIPALMAPFVSDLRTLEQWDIDAVTGIYGGKQPPPKPKNPCDDLLSAFQCLDSEEKRREFLKGFELLKRGISRIFEVTNGRNGSAGGPDSDTNRASDCPNHTAANFNR